MAHVDHNGDKFALVFPLIRVHFERAFLELPFFDKEREREKERESFQRAFIHNVSSSMTDASSNRAKIKTFATAKQPLRGRG